MMKIGIHEWKGEKKVKWMKYGDFTTNLKCWNLMRDLMWNKSIVASMAGAVVQYENYFEVIITWDFV